ncbi:unnamed protein product, partial [marine sediment metagenome]
MKIEEMHSTTLGNLPTPLTEMPVLSAKLGPQIFIKRDDLIGLAMGGQKCRMLESVMSEAKDMGADILIAAGRPHGNQGVQLAAAAHRLGMDITMFLYKGNCRLQGNFLLLNLLGTQIKVTDMDWYGGQAKLSEQMESLAAELRSKGRRPYVIHSLKTPLAIVGYAHAVSEICK